LPGMRVRQRAADARAESQGDSPECGRSCGEPARRFSQAARGGEGLSAPPGDGGALMASWSAAAAHAEAPLARPRPRPRAVAARRPLDPLRSGVTWIAVLAALLGGIVALNVAVLQLNVRLSSLSRERASLRSENASLQSQLSSAAASPRIQTLAHKRLGLVPASDSMYVELEH